MKRIRSVTASWQWWACVLTVNIAALTWGSVHPAKHIHTWLLIASGVATWGMTMVAVIEARMGR